MYITELRKYSHWAVDCGCFLLIEDTATIGSQNKTVLITIITTGGQSVW